MKKLKERWGITSNWSLVVILIVFAVTGSSAAYLANPVMDLLGLDSDTTNALLYWPLRILLIFPIYQVLLVTFGYIAGQGKFFWNFEKRMLRHLGLGRFLAD